MLQEFKKFLMRGNVIELAVGLVIGAAFTAVVTSFVNDLLMPPIGLLLGGRTNFTDLLISLDGRSVPSLAAAKAAGAPTLNYGAFLTTILNFIIIGFAVFLVVRAVNRLAAPPAPPPPAATRDCPFCTMAVSLRATRCPHCTSELRAGA
jgi:large conductance mechanosensitive channel